MTSEDGRKEREEWAMKCLTHEAGDGWWEKETGKKVEHERILGVREKSTQSLCGHTKNETHYFVC